MPDPNDGADISNYTSAFTAEQIQTMYDTFGFTIIGIQDTQKALNFQRQLSQMELQYYVDRPMRDWSVFPWYANTKVWIDIERDCYERVADVDMDLRLLEEIGCRPGIYCNETSLGALDGPPNPDWGRHPLWYASYAADRHKPTLSEFAPFHTWTAPEVWQYSEKGHQGINCDLNVRFVPVPPQPAPELPYTLYFKQFLSDGTVWHIDAVPPPGR